MILDRSCFFCILRSVFVRLLFIIHGGLAVHFLITFNSLHVVYYVLTVPLILLALEGIVMTVLQTSLDIKRFWPICGILYLASVIPIIWITELDLKNINDTRLNTTLNRSNLQNVTEIEDPLGSFTDFFGINESIVEKWCEVGIFIVLIAGRWIISLDDLSRDELTALLLALVGHAPDSMDLIKPLDTKPHENTEENLIGNTHDVFRVYIILAVYSFSVIQFAIRTPDIQEKKNERASTTNFAEIANSARFKNISKFFKKGKVASFPLADIDITNTDSSSLDKNDISTEQSVAGSKKYKKNDVMDRTKRDSSKKESALSSRVEGFCTNFFGTFVHIFIALCLHAGPAFVLRLVMTVRYNVLDEMHLFFLVKNGVEIIVLLHRFYLTHRSEKSRLNEEGFSVDIEKADDRSLPS